MNDDRQKRSAREVRRGDRPVAAPAETEHSVTATPASPALPAPGLSAAPEPSPASEPVSAPAPELDRPSTPPAEALAAPRADRDPGPEWIAQPPGFATGLGSLPWPTPEAAADNPWAVFAEAQAAFARGLEEMAGEVTGLTRTGLAATADAAVALLGARSFAEIVEINAGLARRGVDVMIDGSARLSEIGVKAVSQATRPLLSRLGGAWSEAEPR